MTVIRKSKGAFDFAAYVGDAKTLLAFNLTKAAAKNLAGFTIQYAPDGLPSHYIFNTLQFEKPADHAQDAQEPPNSSINAPIHKFRWLHVPGSVHQGTQPFLGNYTYTATPRFFDANKSLLPLDPTLSVAISVPVRPFVKGSLQLGFTRGFVQSQAFVNHFGPKALIRPKGKELLYDTSVLAGTNAQGQKFTYADEYDWLGFTARRKVLDLVNEVVANNALSLDMFAYDLNEPDLLKLLLQLAGQGRLRLVLDDAALHHNKKKPKPEDEFETLFNNKKKGKADIKRGHFGRYAHDKVLIISGQNGPQKVLTGSTNFSVTGFYVNSNHVLVYDDATVAGGYSAVFEEVWNNGTTLKQYLKSPLSAKEVTFKTNGVPDSTISFAPHDEKFSSQLMSALAKRIGQEKNTGKALGSVLFAIMDIGSGDGPVRPALVALHGKQSVFSYGISDTAKGIKLYVPKRKEGVLVTGKPTNTILPPPFSQVPNVGIGHQIHHKFVVCGFNTPDAVVYCGSSNLASSGESANGDNLLAIHDTDVATAFAIEAVALVDHFEFLDRLSKGKSKKKAPASKQLAAVAAKWWLSVGDGWTKPFFDSNDLRSVDRELFGR
ncbi:MAG TPA: phospholipase D-like domain-containing protein [Blastocatellia bacterium]|nr:phospholipase D-like domain-containing protein [Blastocatellia bacterium]